MPKVGHFDCLLRSFYVRYIVCVQKKLSSWWPEKYIFVVFNKINSVWASRITSIRGKFAWKNWTRFVLCWNWYNLKSVVTVYVVTTLLTQFSRCSFKFENLKLYVEIAILNLKLDTCSQLFLKYFQKHLIVSMNNFVLLSYCFQTDASKRGLQFTLRSFCCSLCA